MVLLDWEGGCLFFNGIIVLEEIGFFIELYGFLMLIFKMVDGMVEGFNFFNLILISEIMV